MGKLLTIGIPAYNIEEYLAQCLDSVLLPDIVDDLEVIVVNDGSTDHTEDIALSYCERYPDTVRVITKPNGGWGSGVNVAMTEAKGEFFKNLDSDDWFDENGFRILLKNMRENPADIMVSPGVEYSMKDGKTRPMQFPSVYMAGTVMSFPEMCESLNYLFRMQCLAFRTSQIRKNDVHLDECYYADLELISYPLVGAETIFIQTEPVYMYRLGRDGQSMSFPSMAKHMEDITCVTNSIVNWYLKLEQTEKNPACLDFWRRITKVAITSYLNQPSTVLDKKKQKSYVAELKHFKTGVIDKNPSLQTMEDYGIFAKLLIMTDFRAYPLQATLWRIVMKNSAAASALWRVIMNLQKLIRKKG